MPDSAPKAAPAAVPDEGFDVAMWAVLAAHGAVVGLLALARNFDSDGGSWRRTDANGAAVDRLLAAVPDAGMRDRR